MTTTPLAGTRILLTGGTDGVGKVAATDLATLGATVVVTGRDRVKAAAAVAEIREKSGNDDVSHLVADFATLAGVRSLADDVRERFDSLDVLINNAGLWAGERVVTADAHELTFAVNYLAPFVLTTELLPLLARSERGRVVNVASILHRSGSIDFEDLHGTESFSASGAYRQSKLALVAFTAALDQRLSGTDVVAVSVEPGFVPGTGLYRDLPWYVRILAPVLSALPLGFTNSPAAAAETYVFALRAPASDVAGRYLADGEPVEPAPEVHDPEFQRRLWETSVELTGCDPQAAIDELSAIA